MHLPSYMTVDLCIFLSFSGNRARIFFVFQMILKMYRFCVKSESLSVNLWASNSFFSQYGSRMRIVCLSSNNQGGIVSVSVGELNSLIVAFMKCFGYAAFWNFVLIRSISVMKSLLICFAL